VRKLWRLADQPTESVVTWQRAVIVLWSALGLGVPAVAHRVLLSEQYVRAIVTNFNLHGFASLMPAYGDGRFPALTPEEERDAVDIAGRHPNDFGLPISAWDEVSLTEFLVAEGVIEDIAPTSLSTLLRVSRVAPQD
jgi:hypothetical protein